MAEQQSINLIIAIKGFIKCNRTSSSGIFLILIDSEREQLVHYYSTVITSYELYWDNQFPSFKESYELIKTADQRYSISATYKNKLDASIREHLVSKNIKDLSAKLKANDFTGAEYFFKNALQSIFISDKIDVRIDAESVSNIQIEEYRAAEQMDSMPYLVKINRISRYTGNENNIADKVLRESIKDMRIVRFTCVYQEKEIMTGILLFNIFKNDFIEIIIGEPNYATTIPVSLADPLLSFYTSLKTYEESKKINNDFIADVSNGFREYARDTFGDICRTGDMEKMKVVIGSIVKKNLKCDCIVSNIIESYNSLYIDLLLKEPGKIKQIKKIDLKTEEELPGLRMIDVQPVLSPTKGVAVSTLSKGDRILVYIDNKTIVGRKIIKDMNLQEGEKIKTIMGKIYSLKYTQNIGYTLIVEIAAGIFGKIIEEDDIKIKIGDPLIEEHQQRLASRLGLYLSIVLIIMILIFIFVLKLFKFSGN